MDKNLSIILHRFLNKNLNFTICNRLMLPKFKRILLKLSGESLMGDKNFGLDSQVLSQYAQDIKLDNRIGCTGCHCNWWRKYLSWHE